jgi:hypothetical protein
MEPTSPQLTFLAELRRGPRGADAHLDASMVGPLIRANLVQCDDEPGDAARRRRPPSTIFALTPAGCMSAGRELNERR